MSSANVRSVEALKDFKLAMVTFAEEARVGLDSVQMELRRYRDWLERDQLGYWKSQIKHWQEQVSMARTELHRRQLSAQNSDAISDTEQKEALQKAKRRLDEAEEKVAVIKKLIPVFEQAAAQYNAASQPLGDRLSGAFVNSLASLEKMITAIEAYAAVAPPTMNYEVAGTVGGSSGAATKVTTSATPASDGAAAAAAEAPKTTENGASDGNGAAQERETKAAATAPASE